MVGLKRKISLRTCCASTVFCLAVFGWPDFSKANDVSFFPPNNCSSDKAMVVALQDGQSSTVCVKPEDIIKAALKNAGCTEGQTFTIDASGNMKCK